MNLTEKESYSNSSQTTDVDPKMSQMVVANKHLSDENDYLK